MKRAALLTLLPLLTACQDRAARAQNAELTQRVAALEAQVKVLQKQAQTAVPMDAEEVSARASAQNCALQLARSLEDYRRSNAADAYPERKEMDLPPACRNQKVTWRGLKASAYSFAVLGADGAVLAEAEGN